MIKRWLQKLTKKEKKYPNRFLKFYYENKDDLLKERKSLYYERQKAGICVRCKKPALSGVVFCEYHQLKHKEYNTKART